MPQALIYCSTVQVISSGIIPLHAHALFYSEHYSSSHVQRMIKHTCYFNRRHEKTLLVVFAQRSTPFV